MSKRKVDLKWGATHTLPFWTSFKLGLTLSRMRSLLSFNFLLVCVFGFTLLSIPHFAHARELHGRLGLGYNGQFENTAVAGGVPGLSVKYGVTRDISGEVIVGVSTASPVNSVAAVKFSKIMFFETNLNFYFMVGGGLLSGSGASGAEFLGGFGAEFFIPGIESLGFATETGVTLDNLGGSFVFKTMGISFLTAGIHFYL